MIRLYDFIKQTRRIKEKDSWQINPDGKYPRLQKFLFWVLLNLGITHQKHEIIEWKTITVDFQAIEAAVQKSREITRKIHSKEARYLVVGQDYYQKILRGYDSRYFGCINFPDNYQANFAEIAPDGKARKLPMLFQGLTVVFVPWFDGMVVLPEINSEKSPVSRGTQFHLVDFNPQYHSNFDPDCFREFPEYFRGHRE